MTEGQETDQKLKAEERLEALLLDGLDSGQPSAMTREYWANIRAAVALRLNKHGS